MCATKTEKYLLEQYGPLLSIEQLANMLDRSIDGLRLSLTRDGEISKKFNPAKTKIGRRIYFHSIRVAKIIDGIEEGS